MADPASLSSLEDYLQAASRLPRGSPAPPPPVELASLPIDDRVGLAVHAIEGRRTGRYDGPGFFAAGSIAFTLLESRERPSRPTLELLLHAIGATGTHLCGYPWEHAWKAAKAELESSGLTPSLYDALRAMQGSMRVHMSDKNAALQIDRALWFDTWTPLDPRTDAADHVRSGLRKLPPEAWASWRALLLHGMNGPGAESPRPPWIKKARKQIDSGVKDVAARVETWLAGVGSLPGIQVSKVGAESLRALVWASAAAGCIPTSAVIAIATRPWTRGREWSTRQERFVASLAWAIEQARAVEGRAALEALSASFGRTSAGGAIQRALAVQP